jgi:hypothetical protein
MATQVVTVTPAQRAAARAYIEIMGGEDNVDPLVVQLAHAERANSNGTSPTSAE